MTANARSPVHGTTSGEAYWGPGDRYVFHVTGAESGDSMFALDCLVGPGGGPPPHRHLAEDELFFLYMGSIEFNAARKTHVVSAGEAIFVPKGLWGRAYWYSLLPFHSLIFGRLAARLAKAAEDRGFDTFYVPEHTHIPVRRDAAHPGTGDETLPDDRYLRTLDPWVSLATAAAVTSKIGLSTAVALPVESDPITLAKAIATGKCRMK